VTRGDVVRVRLASARGHEQRGARFAIVLQADELLALSTVIVAPTSIAAQPASFRPEVDIDGTRTRVLVDQLRAVDHNRIGRPAGRLTPIDRRAVDDALERVLGLV
jgi:mRNA interferase MazF